MKSIFSLKSNLKFIHATNNKMSTQRFNEQFEVLMRTMVEAQECAKGNIGDEFKRIIRSTVNSCAVMYGFSAEEALKRLDSNGEIIEDVVSEKNTKKQKEEEKAEKLRVKEAEKAEKLRVKEAEKLAKEAEKLRLKEEEDRKKGERQCALFWKKQQKIENNKAKEAEKYIKEAEKTIKENQKANESSERSAMKEQDISSKAAEKFAKKAEKLAKKPKKEKKAVVVNSDDESLASTVLMSSSEDEEPHVLFQNIPLINELNSIRDVKKFKNWKKLSPGVKLARQILDI
jgi:hypothetical protein